MKQAARMQQQMEQVQKDLAARTVEGTAGGGAVKVAARCDSSIASIKIDPAALNPADTGQGNFHAGNGQGDARTQPARADVRTN